MSTKALSLAALRAKLEVEDAQALDSTEIAALVQAELGNSPFLPDGRCQVDPRSGDRIIYNSGRSKRPHDNQGEKTPPSLVQGGPLIWPPSARASASPRRTSILCSFHSTPHRGKGFARR